MSYTGPGRTNNVSLGNISKSWKIWSEILSVVDNKGVIKYFGWFGAVGIKFRG